MSSTRVRSFSFTLNNYTEDDVQKIDKFSCDYIVFSYEVGDSGTPHLQGYVELANAMTLSALKKKFSNKAHIEKAAGTAEQNHQYIVGPYTKGEKSKPFNPNHVVRGIPKQQGERHDLAELRDEILSGNKVDTIVMERPMLYHQYGRTLHKIEDIRMRSVYRTEMTKGLWIFGTTGTGKSKMAFENYNPATHYVWKYDGGWQDGYAQQDTVIIDEFRGQIPYNELLSLIDIQPNCTVRRRGREPLPFVSKMVIITSSLHPREVYRNLAVNDSLDQLLRRIELKKLCVYSMEL